jgi:geranylgeranyl diphosphate synthase, type II
MKSISTYSEEFNSYLAAHPLTKSPLNLYEPADYILSLGGKRLRPIFVLIGSDLFNGDLDNALKAAMAVEVFHNFTLLHDDIMDAADIRRGQPTVHKKYNTNTAILTGDVMMIKSYQYLLDIDDQHQVKSILDIFNKMALEVCEGQQMDVDFENMSSVTIDQYLEMITLKTSVLIGAAAQIGAIIGGASSSDQGHIYQFAKNFGIAFQLQDDILDTFGESEQVGKRIGGDIIQNKKTYLYLKALELSSDDQKDKLLLYYSGLYDQEDEQKIDAVKSIFTDVLVREYAQQVIEAYRDLAISHLIACKISVKAKENLTSFVNSMIFRSN